MERLAFCVQELPMGLREAVILRCYQGLPFEDIREIVGIVLIAGFEKIKGDIYLATILQKYLKNSEAARA
jgi:hypothetical protein